MHNISLFYKLFINFYLTTYKYSQTISSYLSIQMIIHFSNSFSFKNLHRQHISKILLSKFHVSPTHYYSLPFQNFRRQYP